MRGLLVLTATWSLLAFAAPARADGAVDARAAQLLFERGRAAAARGNFEAACGAFAESQRLDPGAGTLLNWASCEARLNKLASAWQHFKEAEALLKPWDDRRAFVQAQLKLLSPRLSRVTIRLAPGSPAAARVWRGGIELATENLGVPMLVDPGEVELVVACPGRHPSHERVRVREGQELDLLVEPGEPLQTPRPPLTPKRDEAPPIQVRSWSWQRDLGWSFVAVGTAGAGLGLVSGVIVQKREAEAELHCPDRTCDARGYRAAQSGRTWLGVNTLSWAVGAAALAGGGALLLLAPSRDQAAMLTPVPGGAAFSYAGRY
jgi:hypothetical protein